MPNRGATLNCPSDALKIFVRAGQKGVPLTTETVCKHMDQLDVHLKTEFGSTETYQHLHIGGLISLVRDPALVIENTVSRS